MIECRGEVAVEDGLEIVCGDGGDSGSGGGRGGPVDASAEVWRVRVSGQIGALVPGAMSVLAVRLTLICPGWRGLRWRWDCGGGDCAGNAHAPWSRESTVQVHLPPSC